LVRPKDTHNSELRKVDPNVVWYRPVGLIQWSYVVGPDTSIDGIETCEQAMLLGIGRETGGTREARQQQVAETVAKGGTELKVGSLRLQQSWDHVFRECGNEVLECAIFTECWNMKQPVECLQLQLSIFWRTLRSIRDAHS